MRACPFCSNAEGGNPCGLCGRAPTASRKVCAACKKMTPLDEPQCSHCGTALRSELRWKIPVIVAMFVAAISVSAIVEVFMR